MTESFENKIVIVTGAGRGIGRSIAEAFAEQGAKVVIAARTVSYGEETVAHINSSGGTASLFQIDVNDQEAVEELIDDTVQRYGGIDIIVHSAADIPHGGVMTATDEAIDKGISSIIKASFWLARAAAPYLSCAKDGGRMIFISSICGPKTVLLNRVAYGVAKAGLDAFIRGAALEFSRSNITVNGIEPGLIASARAKEALNDEAMTNVTSALPIARAGEPEEIAHVALFLASKHSSYITGESIVIDGGSTLSTSSNVSNHLINHQ